MKVGNLYRFLTRMFFLGIALSLLAGSAHGVESSGKPRNLHMVAVGISHVPNQNPLPSCRKDGLDMVEWATAQKSRLFKNVHAVGLIDGEATQSRILDAVAALRTRAKPGDYSIVYLSSHGSCGADGEFLFAAMDGNIRWKAFRERLKTVPGTVIVIIDACHCGNAAGDNLIVLSASLKNQFSCGFKTDQMNSLFTEHLLAGLRGKADMNKDHVVTLAEVEAYVSNELARCNLGKPADKHQSMTISRPPNLPSTLPLARLTPAAHDARPAIPVPVAANLVGTTWNGLEDIHGPDTRLTFRFLADGRLVMVDVASSVTGSWTQEGNRVTIRFDNCTYYATLNGEILSGHGKIGKRTWNFLVTLAK